ncbi:MAG: branched-chain-amino-acid transaminase [Elusimicrobiota bacterium]|jgi:branched-chain amino acid aminotransferase
MKIYLDGRFVPESEAKLSVFDHGLLYGDGIFEGLRAYDGRVFRLREHLERLYDGAHAIFLKIPLSMKEMEAVVLDSIRANELKDAYVRLVVTRGFGDLGLDMRKCPKPTIFCIAGKIQLYPPEVYEKGLKVLVSSMRRFGPDQLSPSIKSLNYLNNVLARAEAVRNGCHEALLLNKEGYVAECSADNIFYVRHGRLCTPPVSAGILQGVTRDAVLELAAKLPGLQTCEELFSTAELYRAEEIFVTGTGAEIAGVVELDGRRIGSGKVGPVTRGLAEAFRALAASTGTPVY